MKSPKVGFSFEKASLHKDRRALRSRAVAGFFAVALLLGVSAPPARGAQKDDNQVVFLVARSEINDPFFSQSVVLMLPAEKSPLIVGLIVNKPTQVTLGKLFPESPELQGRTEPAYFGGPVDVGVPSVVFHSTTAPERALRVYGNVYLTFDSDLITKVFQNSQPASLPHLFLGRAQWAPAQLENEMERGSWYRVRAQGNLIFGNNLQGLWRKLHDQAAPRKYIQYREPDSHRRAAILNTPLSD